jgi:hypothetical protein
MKRLFSVLMLAVVATLTFAFTTPSASKSSAFAQAYHFDASLGTWEQGAGAGCGQAGTACQYISDINLSGADFAAVQTAIGTSTANKSVSLSGGRTAQITAVLLKNF